MFLRGGDVLSPPLGLSHPWRPALEVLGCHLSGPLEVFLVLGSGLGGLVREIEEPVHVPYDRLPGFPPVGVAGHAGEFVIGRLEGRRVLVQSGRFHLYEGHPPSRVVMPVRLAAALGAGTAVFTNAAGALDSRLGPGDLVVLGDHVNLMGRDPFATPDLVAARLGVKGTASACLPQDSGGERGGLPPGTRANLRRPYDPHLQSLALEVARELRIPLAQGSYAAVLGPSYETPAEVRFLQRLGAAVVGMSTVPEVLMARALGLRVLAFSLVTNPAAGLGKGALDHGEVLEVGRAAAGRLGDLLRALVQRLPPPLQPPPKGAAQKGVPAK